MTLRSVTLVLTHVLLHIACPLPLCSTLVTFFFFFFNDTATTEIYTLSLHDALPISRPAWRSWRIHTGRHCRHGGRSRSSGTRGDRKSTRLNSSHTVISYAVFCLKKKKKKEKKKEKIKKKKI